MQSEINYRVIYYPNSIPIVHYYTQISRALLFASRLMDHGIEHEIQRYTAQFGWITLDI